MHKVVVVADVSLWRPPRSSKKGRAALGITSLCSRQDTPFPDFEIWVPLDYTIAQLKQDVARHWHVQPSKCQVYDHCDIFLDPRMLLGSVVGESVDPIPPLTLKKVTWTSDLSSGLDRSPWSTGVDLASTVPEKTAQSTDMDRTSRSQPHRPDPFWVREKLFELFLFYALQNVSGKALLITSYQFKSLLQRAISSRWNGSSSPSITQKSPRKSSVHRSRGTKSKDVHRVDFDARVLLAFRGAVANPGNGAGASFDEFLDALVDAAGILFPKMVASRVIAFEQLTTKFVIPQYESEQYVGGSSALSWTQMDALLLRPAAKMLIQRFAKVVGELTASYSTTIGRSRTCRALQFHELSKFLLELKIKSLTISTSELCSVFIRCCQLELSEQYSDAMTLGSLFFSSSSASSGTKRRDSSIVAKATDRFSKTSIHTSSVGGNFAIHGGGDKSRSDTTTDMGGALEIVCTKVMGVFGYVALMAAPRLVKTKDRLQNADFSSLQLDKSSNDKLVLLSVKAFLQLIANQLSGKNANQQHHQQYHYRHPTKHGAVFELASVQFLQEFQKLHQEDGMTDYLSELSNEIRKFPSNESSKQQRGARDTRTDPSFNDTSSDPELDTHSRSKIGKDFGLDLDWKGADSDIDASDRSGSGSDSDSESTDESTITRIDPQLLQTFRLRELEDLREVLNKGDEIYSFLASELQRCALTGRRIDDTDIVVQMLDMWVAAGQKYAQVIASIDSMPSVQLSNVQVPYPDVRARWKASFLQRFGSSLYVLATQLLNSTTSVYAYERIYSVTNARVYSVDADCWSDAGSVFTTDLALETLSLASAKLASACQEFIALLERVPDTTEGSNETSACKPTKNCTEMHTSADDEDHSPHQVPDDKHVDYANYIECLFLRASCLVAYGDIIAHNQPCMRDYELGCLIEEELDGLHNGSSISNDSSDGFAAYCSSSTLTKSSSSGQFYSEANRILHFIQSRLQHPTAAAARIQPHKVHLTLAMTQFKLATHLPRGCVAEKKLLEEALVHLAICQKNDIVGVKTCTVIADKKEYISAILVLRQRFFQPEVEKPSKQDTKDAGLPGSRHATQVEENISPFYRFILAAAFKDFDSESTGMLTQPQLNSLNSACGRGCVTDSTMQWLLLNFDHQGNGLTEKGLLQYFCWIAEADPVAFCEILDIFTSKYTETHHASITASRPAHISKEPKAKSLRSIFFADRRQLVAPSAATRDRQHRGNTKGIAECVVVLSGKMTPTTCGDLRNTKSPSDIRLEPEVVDVLPSSASVPDELSKFCFPDDVFLYDELLPPKAFDIVLTGLFLGESSCYRFTVINTYPDCPLRSSLADMKGERLYGSCLHFYEEKNPMEVLALISGMQKGRTASLPSWISLRDIQQHKTRWKCFVPKCLCVLSSYPLFQTFRTFLAQLYRLSMSAPTNSAMETFVFNLLAEIPLPRNNLAQTSFSLIDKPCLLTGCAPGMPIFYPTEVDFTLLFQCLSPENVLRVYALLLTEKKLVVCSENLSVITPVMETFRALLHPLECQVVYIPVLPLSLLDFVSAPVPFFMGMRSDPRVGRLIADGIVVVDLDKNELALPPNEAMPSLPDVKAKKLLQVLRKASIWAASHKSKENFGKFKVGELTALAPFDDTDRFQIEIAELSRTHDDCIEKWTELQTLFTSFATRLLKDVRKYCSKVASPKDPSETVAFDKRGFLNMHPSAREFYTQLFQTQLFQRFIEQSSLGGTLTSGGEQENFWHSARSMSVIWKSEPAEEPAKTPPRQIVRAPPLFKNKEPGLLLTQRSTSQRRASLSTIDAFPMFNAHVYELLAQNSGSTSASADARKSSCNSCNDESDPRSSSAAVDKSDNSRVRPGSPATSSGSFSRVGFNSTASKLVSAARERVEAETMELHRR